MPDQSRAEIIEQNPVGNGLEGIRASYRSLCNDKGFPYELDTLDRLDAKGLSAASVVYHPPLTTI